VYTFYSKIEVCETAGFRLLGHISNYTQVNNKVTST